MFFNSPKYKQNQRKQFSAKTFFERNIHTFLCNSNIKLTNALTILSYCIVLGLVKSFPSICTINENFNYSKIG